MTITTPPTSVTPPPEEESETATGRRVRPVLTFDTLAVLAFVLALGSVAVAVFAVGLASRAIDEHRAIPTGGGAASSSVNVVLTEWSIAPALIAVSAGSILSVSNDGAVPHNLAVDSVVTPDLAPGAAAQLDVSAFAPGTYTIYCKIAGHRELGMENKLTVQ